VAAIGQARAIDANADMIAARVARVRKVAGIIARHDVTGRARPAQRTPEGPGRKVAAEVIAAEVTVAGKARVATNAPALAKTLALPHQRLCRMSR
jgi:hypothetical protein